MGKFDQAKMLLQVKKIQKEYKFQEFQRLSSTEKNALVGKFEDTALAASVRIPMSLPYMRDLGECTRSTKQLHPARRSSKVTGIDLNQLPWTMTDIMKYADV